MRQIDFQREPMAHSHVRIGDVVIDLRCRRIVTPDDSAELPQRVFDLLMVFMSEPHVLHVRPALFDRVWAGLVVEEGNLNQSVSVLRKSLGASRKSWIRTVAKSGYMFEPPFAVEPFDGSRMRQESTLPADSADPASASSRPPSSAITVPHPQPRLAVAAPGRLRGYARKAGVAVSFVVLLLVSASSTPGMYPVATSTDPRATGRHLESGPPPVSIAILREVDAGGATLPAWPEDLLEEWLSWKIGLLPQAVAPASSLPQDDGRSVMNVTVLRVVPVRGRSDRIALRLRIEPRAQDPSGARDPASAPVLSVEGAWGDVPSMVDTLSQQALTRILQRKQNAQWPAMNLSSPLAETYALAGRAMRRRDWPAGYSAIEDVIAGAPAFGPAYLKRAEILHRRGRTSDALADMNRGLDLLASAPADARRSLEAVEAWMDPRRLPQAMEVNCGLAETYPARDDFTLSCASLLFRNGRNHDALTLLRDPVRRWEETTLATRVRHGLILSEALLGLGDPERSKRSAEGVVRMLASSGTGWELEQGRARMMIARAFHRQPGGQEAPALFELASDAFEAGGDHFDALYAGVLAESHRTSSGDPMSPRMRALLVDAHRGGFLKVEIELLRQAAYIHRDAGRIPQFRTLMRAAESAAFDSDDISAQRDLDLDLLQEDIWLGNFASAESRIKRLHAIGVEGARALDLRHFEAALELTKGRYSQALSRLGRESVQHAWPEAQVSQQGDAAYEACLRADILLAQGEAGAAKTQVGRCRVLGAELLRLRANTLGAMVSLYEGDPEGARALMSGMERRIDALPSATERWTSTIEAATTLTGLGECDRAEYLLQRIRPTVEASGYRLMRADIETALAEISAARGQWDQSRRLSRQVRRWVPGDLWLMRSRLDMLAILDERMTGTPADVQAAALRAQAHRLGDAAVVRQLDAVSTGGPGGGYRCMSPRAS